MERNKNIKTKGIEHCTLIVKKRRRKRETQTEYVKKMEEGTLESKEKIANEETNIT